MNIRLETPADYREVENLTREAFWNVYRPGCTEHYVLNLYRSNPDFIPELDFVMEEEGRLGIHYHDMPREDEVPFFLAQELIPGWLKAGGITEATYAPPKGYFVADENQKAFEAYEATFPPKEKLRLPGQLGYEE